MRHYAYRTTGDKLNAAYARIDDDAGQVVDTIHLGGRDFVVVFIAPAGAPAGVRRAS